MALSKQSISKKMQIAFRRENLNEAWLPLIVKFAIELNADCVQVIDNNYFSSKNVSDDASATQPILNVVEQMKEYPRSVIIFDMDEISCIHK
jgi:hypothetical protein